jgi:hypothetical protein
MPMPALLPSLPVVLRVIIPASGCRPSPGLRRDTSTRSVANAGNPPVIHETEPRYAAHRVYAVVPTDNDASHRWSYLSHCGPG